MLRDKRGSNAELAGRWHQEDDSTGIGHLALNSPYAKASDFCLYSIGSSGDPWKVGRTGQPWDESD